MADDDIGLAAGGSAATAYAEAVTVYLACALEKTTDYSSTVCSWISGGQTMRNTFGRQAIPMVWDYAEPNTFGEASGAFSGGVEWIVRVINHSLETPGHAELASATNHPLPDDSANVLFTDPPYYDAVPYAHLSDFFYVWLRRVLINSHPELFRESTVAKEAEIVVDRPHYLSSSKKDIKFYEQELTKAFAESRRILNPAGIGAVVFASKTTSSWEAILQALSLIHISEPTRPY